MGDLDLTKEFRETTAAISRGILQNPQKYEQAGEWLDQNFFEDGPSWLKMLTSSKRLVDLYFSDEGLSWAILPSDFSDRDKIMKRLVQAVAAIEFGKFLSMSDCYLTDEILTVKESFTKKKFVELASESPECQNKRAIPSAYKLWLACEEMLEIKNQCNFIGQQESMIVCLTTWLLVNPDANKADLGITKFDRWEWYALSDRGIHSRRADAIKLLHVRGMLGGLRGWVSLDWQNLACEAWQNVKNVDSKTGAPTGGASSSQPGDKTSAERSENMIRVNTSALDFIERAGEIDVILREAFDKIHDPFSYGAYRPDNSQKQVLKGAAHSLYRLSKEFLSDDRRIRLRETVAAAIEVILAEYNPFSDKFTDKFIYHVQETLEQAGTAIQEAIQDVAKPTPATGKPLKEPIVMDQKDIWGDTSREMKKAIQDYWKESKAKKSEGKRLLVKNFCRERGIDEKLFNCEKDRVRQRKKRIE